MSIIIATVCICLFVSIPAATAAKDDTAADNAKEVLEGKGLRKLGSYFSLTEEVDVKRALREIELLRKKLRDSQRNLDDADEVVEKKRKLTIDYLQQRRDLRARLARTTSVKVHNQLVTALNELGDRINLMHQDDSDKQQAKQARATHETLQAEYVEKLLKTRKLYDQVAEKYKDLKVDSDVSKAIETYNQSLSKPCKLGPGLSYASLGRKLKKIEDTVLSESIDLRKGGGNLWIVPVAFNEGKVQPMAIDTGASIISMPWNMAAAIGMTPTPSDEQMQVSLADGRIVTATRKMATKVRVGKFTVENVECAVMPQEFTQAAPLLGLSFFKHFTFKIDNANAKLVMSKVESLDGKSSGKSRRKRGSSR
ncbi:MAG: retroviral-like aspartic protease family protein [Pirellulales bacterium]|nr:retroviral-like aspartic protease family protein [Pirellulales bacterium]